MFIGTWNADKDLLFYEFLDQIILIKTSPTKHVTIYLQFTTLFKLFKYNSDNF